MDQGQSPARVTQGFLGSPEYQARIIGEHYTMLLGRQPEPGADADWLPWLRATGGYEAMTIGVLASPEYYGRHGSDPQQWVAALYADVLGRRPDPDGDAGWLGRLQAGMTRAGVAAGFVGSVEARQLCVREVYATLLGRSPEQEGLDGWTQALGGGMTAEQLVVRVAGSAEFSQLMGTGMLPWEGSMSPAAPSFGPAGAISPFASDAMNAGPSARSGTAGPMPLSAACGEPPDYVPFDTSCCTSNNSPVWEAPGANGGSPMAVARAQSPIRYIDGTVVLAIPELESDGYGAPWGQTLTWTNGPNYANGGFYGNGMVVSQLPHLDLVILSEMHVTLAA